MATKNQFTKDFIRKMTESSASNTDSYNILVEAVSSIIEQLDNIDSNLQQIAANRKFPSQGAARYPQTTNDNTRPFGQHHANYSGSSSSRSDSTLLDSLDNREFKHRLQRGLKGFADHFGEKLSDIVDDMSSELEKQIAKKIKTDSISKKINSALSNLTNRIVDNINNSGPRSPENSNASGSANTKDSSEYLDSALNYLEHLSSIDENLRKISEGRILNESNTAEKQTRRGVFDEDKKSSPKGFLDNFEDALTKDFKDMFTNTFKEAIGETGQNFLSNIDVDEIGQLLGKLTSNTLKQSGPSKALNDLVGKAAGKIFNKDSVKGLGDLIGNLKGDSSADLGTLFKGLQGIDLGNLGNGLVSGGSKLVDGFTNLTSTVGGSVVATAGVAVAMKAVEYVVKTFQRGLHLASEGLEDFKKAITDASTRYYDSRTKNIELANERLRADIDTLIKEPFNILKKAADEVYSAWNANTRLIAGTQGYRKEDLQDLMSAYSSRLESEGLSKVVSSTDIYNNLAKVIESGLIGRGAVEFAYQATRLNAAVPNQDFFSYVESYASVVANAIAAGKSESEALQIANNSLEEFSNSLLYASRGLTGGYGTSLKSAETTYSAAVKISQAAKSSNINQIASSLLAIQGYVGSIAPDLATSLTDKIYQLATGGNAADIVALRSLAGINASNTEFLKALASNPQTVLSKMFDNLGKMFSQSADAYMEKAEGYASLFGLSPEALQRIDFQSLASAIRNMNASSDALNQNMKLLEEGQTTTTADQLKIEQINKYMIEEGLAYVIDNEAAQMIQEHMWDEQMKRELMEAEYGVNIVGGVAEAIEKIRQGLETIISILNPAAWWSKAGELFKTIDEAGDLKADIEGVLKAGVVGRGSRSDYYNLITRNQDLNLTANLVDMLGGKSRYGNSWYNKLDKSLNSTWWGTIINYSRDALAHPLSASADFKSQLGNQLSAAISYATDDLKTTGSTLLNAGKKFLTLDFKGAASELKNAWNSAGNVLQTSAKSLTGDYLPTSQYSWGSISKSSAYISSALLSKTTGSVSTGLVSNIVNAVSSSISKVKDKLSKLLSGETITEQFVKQGKTYEDWRKALAEQGVADVDQALKDAGYDPSAVEAFYQTKQTEVGMAEKAEDREQQKAFYQAGIQFYTVRYWDEFSAPVKTSLTNVNSKIDNLITLHTAWKESEISQLQSIANNQVDWKEYFDTSWINTVWKTEFTGESGLFTRFFNEFVNKFVEHTYYDASGYKYSDVTDIQRREDAEKGSAVYALADALTGNLVDLKDPQVQTNAILAQILVVVSAIMNQNNNVVSTVSLSDALSGLALGLTTSTPINETPVRA